MSYTDVPLEIKNILKLYIYLCIYCVYCICCIYYIYCVFSSFLEYTNKVNQVTVYIIQYYRICIYTVEALFSSFSEHTNKAGIKFTELNRPFFKMKDKIFWSRGTWRYLSWLVMQIVRFDRFLNASRETRSTRLGFQSRESLRAEDDHFLLAVFLIWITIAPRDL